MVARLLGALTGLIATIVVAGNVLSASPFVLWMAPTIVIIGVAAIGSEVYRFPMCPVHKHNLCTDRVNFTTGHCRVAKKTFAI